MTGGLLDFFTLEATEYVDTLDALASRATSGPPEPDAFARAARGLRGSATMAKLTGIAEVAQGLERVARDVRDGTLAWDERTRAVALGAIDDIKILIRGVRGWGTVEERRAGERIAELERLAPRTVTTRVRGRGSEYLAGIAAEAAAGLLDYAEQPGTAEDFAAIMRDVRALRGVAALRDLPPLAEVVDAVDAAAKPIEIGQDTATAERRRLFRTAARVLLEGGEAVRRGGVPPKDSNAVREFVLATESLRSNEREVDEVVPIASLFPDDETEPVTAGSHPPTTAAQRFRLEAVSQAEHLRRLVADAREASDTASRDRLGRELRNAVRTLARAAQSFAAIEIANVFLAAERGAAALEARVLDVLDEAGQLLSAQHGTPEEQAPRFIALSGLLASTTPSAAGRVALEGRMRQPTPAFVPPTAPAATQAAAPSGAELQSLLATGIAGLAPLGDEHLAAPLVGDEDDVVPIDELLFRGRDALSRAIEIGARFKETGQPPDRAALDELYDLLQLAAAE
ncbi:MAG TPA: hypothetical protein VFM71_05845 [Gemmatimonadaceae bacterium]|nr:hypothetical protein [Gemmatimonadaceae bacterium]